MKDIVLVAPGVHPPLTEGRKLFVLDLAETLRGRGVAVEVISGSAGAGGGRAIHQSLQRLRARCKSRSRIDAVGVFPYGRFEGFRRIANEWLIARTLAYARRYRIPALPVFYSCAGLPIEEVDRKFAPALAIGISKGRIDALSLGVSREMRGWQPLRPAMQRLLFLCGYQQATSDALHGVLYERGLFDLLAAGNGLASAGMRLSIAIPFLREESMRTRLFDLAKRICPDLEIDLQDSINPSSAFTGYDAFMFPYRSDHAVFVPTSLLEAMLSGIPVIASRHEMYRSLTGTGSNVRCELHNAGDPEDLLRAVLKMHGAYESAVRRAQLNSSVVAKNWNLGLSADEFMAALRKVAPEQHL